MGELYLSDPLVVGGLGWTAKGRRGIRLSKIAVEKQLQTNTLPGRSARRIFADGREEEGNGLANPIYGKV
jgi:hypothetical protein